MVTNETFKKVVEDESSVLLPFQKKEASVGVILPNSHGDTYNGAIMAGIKDISKKLNWEVLNVPEVNIKLFGLNNITYNINK